jgi:hypothetical protein
MIVYNGPSAIDGTPIIAIITGLDRRSKNAKTGDMLQLWILARDVHPHEATITGKDVAVCGYCPHRPQTYAAAGVARCYVETAKAPASVWTAYHHGQYVPYDEAARTDKPIRLGAYGDPGALPAGAIIDALKLSNGRCTGYTHRWRERPDLVSCCMASTDTPEEKAAANAAGWRTFSVGDDISAAVLCPASAQAGKRTNCASCLLCSGSRGIDRRANIYIPAH